MSYTLPDLIDMELFQDLQDRLNEIYSFPSAIIDNEGRILTATAWQPVCSEFHRRNEACLRDCLQSDKYILDHLHEANPAVSYRCPRGLVDNATPIIIDGVHYGNFFTGQFFLEPPDMEAFRDQAREFGFDEDAYLAAVAAVPIWSQAQLDGYLFFIKGLITIISESGLKKLRAIEAHRRVTESEERYRQLFDASPDGIVLIDMRGRIVDCNAAQAAMYRYASPDDLLGTAASALVAPVSRPFALEVQQRRLAGEDIPVVEYDLVRRDGTTFRGEVRAVLLRGADGIPQRYICITRDITERTRAEAEKVRLENQLRQEQKLSTVGTLASGVAHEINNPLTGVINYAQLALDVLPPEAERVRGFCREIIAEGSRIADIVRNLLVFSRQEKGAYGAADLGDAARAILSLAGQLLAKDEIAVEVEIAPCLPPVRCQSAQVQQVLLNLLTNARDALNERWPGYHADKSVRLAVAPFADAAGSWVRVTVRDRGPGIPAGARERIFDPFFTTKDRRHGTGLGLSISYGIVQEHGGRLSFETWPGEGTAFHLDLPAVDG